MPYILHIPNKTKTTKEQDNSITNQPTESPPSPTLLSDKQKRWFARQTHKNKVLRKGFLQKFCLLHMFLQFQGYPFIETIYSKPDVTQ